MSRQLQNTNKNVEIVKQDKMDILEQKYTLTEIKNLLEKFTTTLEQRKKDSKNVNAD